MLRINNLEVAYKKKKIIQGLSWEVSTAQIHGLVGLNGAGKTTLLNSIYGITPFQAGEILWKNTPAQSSDFAYLETSLYFYPQITGQEYLSLFQYSNKDFDIKAWNQIFDLPLQKLVEQYSTGMKKKLALLGILSLEKEVLLLDEPLQGLDLEANEIFKYILKKLKEQGKTIIITSHIWEAMVQICDEIHHLHQGKIQKTYLKNDFEELPSELIDPLRKTKFNTLDKLID